MNATITKEIEFDAGHRIPNHGKCANLHGHRYLCRITCTGPIITNPDRPDYGMLADFTDLKTLLTSTIGDHLDHRFIVAHTDHTLLRALADDTWNLFVFPYIPTAENIARWAWGELHPRIVGHWDTDLTLTEVAIRETPTSWAYYHGATR